MQLFKTLLCACLIVFGGSTETFVEKIFTQGPQNHYLMNSSTLFLPTDSITMNGPISDVRTVVINSGVIGGLDAFVPEGVESRAFRDSNYDDYFYKFWHFAHIDEKHKRTNVITIIVSLGAIRISPSGDIEDTNTIRRMVLDSSSDPDSNVYVQVYRAWSVPVTIPLTQANIDGWWHSITHIFHTAMHIWNEVKPWIGVARTVLPILVSLSDTQPGLGLKSITYSPAPQSVATTDSSATNTASSNANFAYTLNPGEMSAVVIFVYLSGIISAIVVPKIYNRYSNNRKWQTPITDKYNRDIESKATSTSTSTTPLV